MKSEVSGGKQRRSGGSKIRSEKLGTTSLTLLAEVDLENAQQKNEGKNQEGKKKTLSNDIEQQICILVKYAVRLHRNLIDGV